MKKDLEAFCDALKEETNAQLNFIAAEHYQIDKLSFESFNYLIQVHQKLKEYLRRYKFANMAEEIRFFKTLKPQISSLLIYYQNLYKLSKNIPGGGYKARREFYRSEQKKLRLFFEDNKDFYRYYRTLNKALDPYYFIRGKHDIKMMDDSDSFEFDENFSTPYSFKVSMILANEKMEKFLDEQLIKLDQDIENENISKRVPVPMEWSMSKTALVELIYALHSVKALNNGSLGLKTIAYNFELIFNINLNDLYRQYVQLKERKLEKTKFLDSLRDALADRLD